MPRLRTFLIPPLVALAGTGFAMAVAQDGGGGRTVPAQNKVMHQLPIRPNPARLAKLLKDWEGQSAKLNTLDVSIYRIDLAPPGGMRITTKAMPFLAEPQLAYLGFNKVKLVTDSRRNWFLRSTGTRNESQRPSRRSSARRMRSGNIASTTQQIFVFPLDKNARKHAVEEGPLPFLFDMKAKEAKARYDMVLLEEDAKKILLKITPKLKEDQDSFSTAWIILDARLPFTRRESSC